MIRMPHGVYPDGSTTDAADYKNDLIRVSDLAFNYSGDQLGEGSYMHEIGHAVWDAMAYGLQQSYTALSWVFDNAANKYILKTTTNNFIDDYSWQYNPKEDFAAHFSAYLTAPEKLEQSAPGKKKWIHDNLFRDTEYESGADSKAKIYVPSDTPDFKAPYFLGDPVKSIVTDCKIYDSQWSQLNVRLVGVVDDLSGFQSCTFNFVPTRDNAGTCGETLQSYNIVPGEPNNFEGTFYVKRQDYTNENYYLQNVVLVDKAGNQSRITIGKSICVKLNGTKKLGDDSVGNEGAEDKKQQAIYSKMSESFKSHWGDTWVEVSKNYLGFYHVHLPLVIDQQAVKLQDVQVNLVKMVQDKNGNWVEKSDDHFWYTFTRADLDKAKGSKDFDLMMDVRNGVQPGRYKINGTSAKYDSLSSRVWLATYRNSSPQFDVPWFNFDKTIAKADVNKMGLSLAKDSKEKGVLHLTSSVPLIGFEYGGKVKISFQAPSGRIYETTVTLKKGETTAQLDIALGEFHEKGEYLVKEIEIWENLPDDANSAIAFNGGNHRVQSLLIRGIKKTITIDNIPQVPEVKLNTRRN